MKLRLLLLLFITLNFKSFGQTADPDYLTLLDKCLYIEYANFKMEIFKNNQVVNYYEMESFRQGDKMRIEFLNPATERGRKMLNDNSNLWMYLPRTSRIMKLPLKQSFMGSDASNRDLMRMVYKKDYEVVSINRRGDNTVELVLKAKDLSVSYNKMILTIDKDKMVPIKQQMYSLSDRLLKTIIFDDVILQDHIYIPTTYKIEDNLQTNTKTILTYKNMRRKNDKQKEFYSLGALSR